MAASMAQRSLCRSLLETRPNEHIHIFSPVTSKLCTKCEANDSSKLEYQSLKPVEVDQIGPADPVSNIRPLRLKQPIDETPLEANFRQQRLVVQQWNHMFWETHNKKFVKEKEAFVQSKIASNGESQRSLNSQEMSEFYKQFLDKYYKDHMQYNRQWYRKNLQLLWSAIQVLSAKVLQRLRPKAKKPD